MKPTVKSLVLSLVLTIALGGVVLVAAQEPAKPQAEPIGPPVSVYGQIMSRFGPVSGAKVQLMGGRESTQSTKSGDYRLNSHVPLHGPLLAAAGKEGYFNNYAYKGGGGFTQDIFLNPLFLNDNPGYLYIPPTTCFACHNKLTRVWNESKMSKATANPLYLSLYYGEDLKGAKRGPGFRKDFPNNEGDCAKCHSPSAAASPGRSWDPRKILQSRATEWPGVSCDYCHKVRKVVPSKLAPSGWVPVPERQDPATGRSILVFGPYADTVVPPMAASYNPLFDQGQFCAACHSHRKVLAKGADWGRKKVYSDKEWASFGFKAGNVIPIQTTFQEWKGWQDSLPAKHPDKGKRCQFCHMSWQKKLLPYDNYLVEGMARNMWGIHRSPNQIRPHHFEGGTKGQLASAVALELSGKIKGDVLTIKVHISNSNGGHWVPTGETMRNLLLLVSAKGLDEKPLKLIEGERLPDWAGKGDPRNGDYAGLPGYAFARVLADDKGNLNVPFWKAARVASDTRLRPKSTRVLTFRFKLKDPADEPTAEAKLIYRPVVRPLAKAKGWLPQDILIASKGW